MSMMLLELLTELTGLYPFSFHEQNFRKISAMETQTALPPVNFNFLLGMCHYHPAVFTSTKSVAQKQLSTVYAQVRLWEQETAETL